MMTKKGVIILLFVVAVLLVIFSLTIDLYVDGHGAKSQTLSGGNGGKIQLAVLPPVGGNVASAPLGNNT